MTNPEQPSPKRGRGRPRVYGKRQNFNFRITKEMRERLIQSAIKHGSSLAEQIEFRFTSHFSREATKNDIMKMHAEAADARSAARIQAIREAGFQILREVEGSPSRVIVSIEMLLGEADGIQRSGFVKKEPPTDEKPPQWSREEIEAKLEEVRRMLEMVRKSDD